MRTAIERVMQAFTMMARLAPEQGKAGRGRLTAQLAGIDADENALAVICAGKTAVCVEAKLGNLNDR